MQKTTLSLNIRSLREAKGLSREELASLLGLSKYTVINYENGANHPSEAVIQKLCDYFQVDREALITGSPVPGGKKKPGRKPAKDSAKKPVKKAPKASRASSRLLEDFELISGPEKEKKKPGRKPGKKPGRKPGRKPTLKTSPLPATAEPSMIIQTLDGHQISTREILEKISFPVDTIYVKPEEGRAYWVRGEESGSVLLW